MSVPQDWVERLALATDYRQLHDGFADMASAARATREPEQVAAAIEQAILGLRRERARDDEELQQIEAQYEQFKAGQGGVAGWLRRHVPFTETRQQEKEHRAEASDQQAEILADNLVIARAQLLRETLLAPAQGHLGADASDWARRLAADEHVDRIKAYAEGVARLARELDVGHAFVGEVKVEVEAFAKAKFRDEEDMRRKKLDLAAAREEVGGAENALQGKRRLREEAVERVRALITQELEANDPRFRALTRRAAAFAHGLAQLEGLAARLEEMRAAVGGMQEAAVGVQALDDRRHEWLRDGARLREAQESAERRWLRADTLARERAGRAGESSERLRLAERAVQSARSAHQGHLAASGQVELPEGVDFEQSSPAARELVRAEAALKETQVAYELVQTPFDAARTDADKALGEVKAAEQDLARREKAEQDLDREERELREHLERGGETLRTLALGTPALMADYTAVMGKLDRRSQFAESQDAFVHRARFALEGAETLREDSNALAQAVKRLEQLLDAAHADQVSLEADREEERRRVASAWALRSQELLGDELASAVF